MKLSDWMAKNGVSDDQMAEKCAVDRVTISRIRRDVNRPSWPLITKIKTITNGAVTADDFASPVGGGTEAPAAGDVTPAASVPGQ